MTGHSVCLTWVVIVVDLDQGWLQVLDRDLLYKVQGVDYWHVWW